MSRVTVYAIDKHNRFDDVGEASNAHNFHVAIWQHLGRKHCGWSREYNCIAIADRLGGPLDKLWANIATLPRSDGLAMAATFDRCWFPIVLRDETVAALREIAEYAPTARAVAELVAAIGDDARGFTFALSLASSWNCVDEDRDDEWHHRVQFERGSRLCLQCGEADIDNASELVAQPKPTGGRMTMMTTLTDAPLADVFCQRCDAKLGAHRYVVTIETIEGKRTPIGTLTCGDGHEQVVSIGSRQDQTG